MRILWVRRLAAVGAAAVITAAGSTATVSAMDQALPGDTAYPAKIVLERARHVLTTDPADEASLYLRDTETRLEELVRAQSTKRNDAIPDVIAGYERAIAGLRTALADLGDDAAAATTDRANRELHTHEHVLNALQDIVPAAARPAIERALDRSAPRPAADGPAGITELDTPPTIGPVPDGSSQQCISADRSTPTIGSDTTLTYDGALLCPDAGTTGEYALAVSITNDAASSATVTVDDIHLTHTTPRPRGRAPDATADLDEAPITIAPGDTVDLEITGTYHLVNTDEGEKANLHLHLTGTLTATDESFTLATNVHLRGTGAQR
ncbi:hypothetical protein SAMN04488563_5294 [Jiangella alkaliphila]|uniref:DUF5667 domain-containing protein n=1 Tax=Jiangella alkaliphila TaxID=419479 RepID=A0A1H2L7E1_9ACTN|nr:hypothetical protein SAMN04488563_5294 [Jiangella alkaliphila]